MHLINVQSFLKREQAIASQWPVNRRAGKILDCRNYESTKYAILSHRWIEKESGETAEVGYEEMVELGNMDTEKQDKIRERDGYQKILRSCKQAERDGFEWLWVDTCCIDKRSSAELSEAINSMYHWYENSARCYAYLHDVPDSFPTRRSPWTYRNYNGWPEWFSRGWTLQELIAPDDVRFFNKDWQPIGDKRKHSTTLQDITRVPQNILTNGFSLTRPCVAQIMSWAADRKTSRVEDEAYSLMGLLGVNMPMLYGEGKAAFQRLQLEIIRMSNDQSIFAWDPHGKIGRSGSVLADEPLFFRDCSDLQTMEIDEFVEALKASKEEEDRLGSFPVTNRGIQILLPLSPCTDLRTVFEATLQCRASEGQKPVTIYLTLWKSNYYRSFGPGSEAAFPKKAVPMFHQIHLRYQDVVHRNPIFEFDDEAVSERGFSCSTTYPNHLIDGNKVELTHSNPLCVRTYANRSANCHFSVSFGQCFGQVWIDVCPEEHSRMDEEQYSKMLIRGPEHAQSMADAYCGPSHLCIKHTRLPDWTVRTFCVMREDSREYPVAIQVFQHPGGSCPGSEEWRGYDRFAGIDLGHRVSRDASQRIGSSTYGDVFEGTLSLDQTKASGNGTEETLIPQPKQKVAVKVVRYVDKNALTVFMRILREIYVWSNLAHANVAQLLGITTNFDHTITIVSPLMSRRDAFRYVQDPNVDPRPLILGIANGLHYLHTHEQGPIIHGDIKGANVLVSNDGQALLTDFGSSRLTEASFGLVINGDLEGTLDWMAPEYFEAGKFTMSITGDVWAFGMTTLELFTRRRPFVHLQSIDAIKDHIVNKELTPPSLDATFFRLTDEWWSICLSCCNRDPTHRTPMSNVVENIRSLQTESKIVVGELLWSVVSQRFASLDLGDRISRDETKVVGFGTHGIVYEGTLNPEQAKVAVKTVRYSDKSALPVLKKIINEVYVWSKLDHENVIKPLGLTAVFDHSLSIVSPLMSRGNAFDYMWQDPVINPHTLILGIAKGLHYLHTYKEGPIIHGDIKGRNILVSDEGHALLSDFGSSHFAAASFNLAVEQRTGGTLNWMAPEYLETKEFKVTTAGDVWAFGMTTLELFTRRRPFDHLKNDDAIIRHILLEERERPKPDASFSRLTDEWWNICLSCWNRDPSQRAQMSHIVRDIGTLQTKSEVYALSLPREVLTNDNSFDPSDPMEILKEIAKRASQYSINLDGLVFKDNVFLYRWGYTMVRSGIFQPREWVFIREAGLCGNGKAIRVAIMTRFYFRMAAETMETFLKEVHAWSKLAHANILPLIGITTQFDMTVSIVCPWMKRGNARDHVQDKSVDPCPLIQGIASGLCYLHSLSPDPLYHGDVRGSNVLISEEGQALIAMSTHRYCRAGLPWIAPEVLEGSEVTAAQDVWAFAMTALELFTREDPFYPINGTASIAMRILKGPPDRPSAENTCFRLTDEWWGICSECWHRDPSSRPTMLQVTEKIEQITSASGSAMDPSGLANLTHYHSHV